MKETPPPSLPAEQDLPKSSRSPLVFILGLIVIIGLVFVVKSSRLGTTPESKSQPAPTTAPAPNVFQAKAGEATKTVNGKVYPFSFSYPESLQLVAFIDDPIDAIAINWNDVPPQQNILANIELLDKKERYYVGRQRAYVEDYWKVFSGLTGIQGTIEEFTNAQGLKAYRVRYSDTNGQAPVQHVFFEVAGNNTVMIHLANGILEPKLFNAMVDSVTYTLPARSRRGR